MSTPTDVEPQASPEGAGDAPIASIPTPRRPSLGRTLAAALVTTAVVTALSWRLPEKYAATGVGLAFLAATWFLVLRHDEVVVRAHGLSLGGLLEPVQISPRRLLRSALLASGWALLLLAITFPPFFYGFRAFYHALGPFHFRLPASILDEVSGQLLVIALPEEAFFRGYLQSALDLALPPRHRLFGADVGPGWILSAAIFAAGHFLTSPHPGRLAVFFPALAFGWLRARSRGIGAGVAFHAACNLFSASLARGYGFPS